MIWPQLSFLVSLHTRIFNNFEVIMKTIQLNVSPPHLIIILNSLHTAFDEETKEMINRGKPSKYAQFDIDSVCGMVTMHFEIKEILRIQIPRFYLMLMRSKKFLSYDKLFTKLKSQGFFKRANKHMDLLTDKTPFINEFKQN